MTHAFRPPHMEQPDIATQLGSIEAALLAILAVLQERQSESDTLRRHLLRQLRREAFNVNGACSACGRGYSPKSGLGGSRQHPDTEGASTARFAGGGW